MMNNRGVTLTELLISVAILSVLMLSLADYSLDILNVADRHSQQVERAKNSRFSIERITEQLNDAAYIFPQGKDISFIVEGSGYSWRDVTVNTDNALALLVPRSGVEEVPDYMYNLVVFYFSGENNSKGLEDLYEFSTSYPSVYWEPNTIPEVADATGTVTLIASDIVLESSSLNYIMNYDDSPTDKVLRGEVRNAEPYDEDALIKGITWDFIIRKNDRDKEISLKGNSRNVPRFYLN